MDRDEFDRYFGLDRWPVTVKFDDEVSVKFETDRIRAECTPVLSEYGSIGEAEDALLGYGFEAADSEVCGHHLTYRKEDGFARILFVPACIYSELQRREVARAMDRDNDRTLGGIL